MATYEVPVTRTVSENKTIEVEATSQEEAEKKAAKEMDNVSADDCWVQVNDIYTGEANPIDES